MEIVVGNTAATACDLDLDRHIAGCNSIVECTRMEGKVESADRVVDTQLTASEACGRGTPERMLSKDTELTVQEADMNIDMIFGKEQVRNLCKAKNLSVP